MTNRKEHAKNRRHFEAAHKTCLIATIGSVCSFGSPVFLTLSWLGRTKDRYSNRVGNAVTCYRKVTGGPFHRSQF